MQNEFSEKLKPFYEQLKPFMADFGKIPVDEGHANHFMTSAKAAFVKCFEFNYDICNKDFAEESFYLIPFLRGICEDLITLRFLYKIEETKRAEIVSLFSILLQLESMRAQHGFFVKETILEPVLNTEESNVESIRNQLKAIWQSLGYNKDKVFPSVEHMAIDTKMKDLYDYLYHATSRAVHFSPNHLLRTGWADKENKVYTFSMKTFTGYYADFLVFYASYLFLKYIKEFKKIFNLNASFLATVKEMKSVFRHLSHCPEIVTYEEMNRKRPFKIVTLLADKSQRFKDSI